MSSAPAPLDTATDEPREQPRRSVLHGALTLLSTQPITWSASLAGSVLVPHYLGANRLGQYSIAVSLVGMVGFVTALGIPAYLIRSIASQPLRARDESSAALVFTVGTALMAAAVLLVALPALRFPVPGPLLGIVLASMVIGSAQGILFSVAVGEERHALYAWLNALSVLAGAIAGIGVLAAGGGLIGYAAATVAVSVAVLLLSWHCTRYHISRAAFDPPLWRTMVVAGLPFLGWDLALKTFGDVDKLILAFLSGASVVGWYAAAIRIISIPVFIPTVITTPLYPALSRLTQDPARFGRTLRRATGRVMILTIPAATGIAALAPSIPHLLRWPQEFEHSVPLLVILSLQQPLAGVGMVLGCGLFALHRERRWLAIAAAAAIFNPALNIALIPSFQSWTGNGAIAAAVVTDATEALMVLGALVLLPRGLVGWETGSLALRVVIASLGVALVASLLRTVSIPLSIAAGIATFALVGIALKVFDRNDIATVYETVRVSVQERLSQKLSQGR